MLDLLVSQLTKSFGEHQILHGVDLAAPAGTLTAILGPSGCGKTTLLRLVAGFESPDSGEIVLGDQPLFASGRSVPPERRQIGYVVQEGALFPHLTVAENIRFGLRLPKDAAQRRALELLEMVGLNTTLAARYPHQLSGGQQQRVALARALAPAPKVVLLDEPFASLDAGLRDSTRRAVAELLAQTGTTVILVTHDQAEALSLAQQVAIMRQGRLLQIASPHDLYRHPVTAEVAASIGETVVLPAVVHDGQATCALGSLPVQAGAPTGPREILLRPEQLAMHPDAQDAGTPATVRSVTFYGHESQVRLELADGTQVTARPAGHATPAVGEQVGVVVQGAAHAFADAPAAPGAGARTAAG
ncbi:MAG: ABC transporter ATP-binding protein [Chloroflexi bacterium]|nr:ABC transporter ATP-binding protein [Chloroflexota bacterium]